MGNTDHVPSDRRRCDGGTHDTDNLRTTLARIAVRLEAQRCELFEVDEHRATLLDRWVASGMAIALAERRDVPLHWFPWSLGSVRPREYLFVRNAGALPMALVDHTERPEHRVVSGADLGVGAALMVPLTLTGHPIGALCVYWSLERQSWESESRDTVASWALDALLAPR